MKKAILFMALVALMLGAASATFAQSRYVLTNDDTAGGANTATAYLLNKTTGALTQFKQFAGNGNGLGGGFFAQHEVTVSEGASCIFFSNSGSDSIAAYQGPAGGYAAAPGMPFSSSGLDGSGYAGFSVLLSNDGTILYASYSASDNIATWKVGKDCSLTLGNVYAMPDTVGPMAESSDGKMLLVNYIDDEEIDAYAISGDTLTEKGGPLTLASYPTGIDMTDVQSGKSFVVIGEAAIGGTLILTATLDTSTGLSNAGSVDFSPILSGGVDNLNSVWLSPKAAATGTGCVYVGASGYPDDSEYAGIMSAQLNAGVLTPISGSLVAWPTSTVEYAGSVQTSGSRGEGNAVYQALWTYSAPSEIAVFKALQGCTFSKPVLSKTTSSNLLTILAYPPRNQ